MMTEFVKSLMTIEFAKVLLIVIGLVAAVFVWIWFTNAMAAQMAGWRNLFEKYPAPEVERPGEVFKRLTGNIGSAEFRRGFTVQLIQEGLLVRPDFARRSPILIPWSKISDVAVSEGTVFGREQYLQLTVEWEKRLLFSLPPKVLPTLEKNVPTDRFRKVKVPLTLLGELLKEGWNQRRS